MIKNVVPFVHDLLKDTLNINDITVDATCGNGHDTLFLATNSKFVYGFDIQELAINNTDRLLQDNGKSNYKLIKDTHAMMSNYITVKVKAITFNLGYLPGSDKSIITRTASTLDAIKNGLSILKTGGLITIILYIGHPGGFQEATKLEEYLKGLPKNNYNVVKYDFINANMSPYVLVIEKR